jgi:hypothetical protein
VPAPNVATALEALEKLYRISIGTGVFLPGEQSHAHDVFAAALRAKPSESGWALPDEVDEKLEDDSIGVRERVEMCKCHSGYNLIPTSFLWTIGEEIDKLESALLEGRDAHANAIDAARLERIAVRERAAPMDASYHRSAIATALRLSDERLRLNTRLTSDLINADRKIEALTAEIERLRSGAERMENYARGLEKAIVAEKVRTEVEIDRLRAQQPEPAADDGVVVEVCYIPPRSVLTSQPASPASMLLRVYDTLGITGFGTYRLPRAIRLLNAPPLSIEQRLNVLWSAMTMQVDLEDGKSYTDYLMNVMRDMERLNKEVRDADNS